MEADPLSPSPDLSHITHDLRPLAVPVDAVHLDPVNARTGHAVDRIAGSLDQYGQRAAIVANRRQGGKIEKGNGTYQAARQLGWQYIAVVWVEDDPGEAAGFAVADNRTGDLSYWDFEALTSAVEAAEFAGAYTGFDEGELDALLKEIEDETPETPEEREQTPPAPSYGVLVSCVDLAHQDEVFNDLKEAGYTVQMV